MTPLEFFYFSVGLALTRAFIIRLMQVVAKKNKFSKRKIYHIAISDKQVKRERYEPLMGALIDSFFMFILFFIGVIAFHNTSITEYVVLLLAHIFIVEHIYYWYHRLLHVGNFYRKHHVKHHFSTVTTPNTSFTFTIIERLSYTLLFSLPVIIASLFGLLSLDGLILYIVGFDIINALGHLNQEIFPLRYCQSWGWKLFYTPTYHSQHHSKFNKNYALFMPIYDMIFKTYEPITEEIFTQVSTGKPLQRLSESPEQA